MPRRKAWKGRPPQDDDAAKRRLLEAAREVVEEIGYEHATLGDVAQRVGVTRQTVYRHFQSSEDLFRAAAALGSGGILERALKVVGKQSDFGERLAAGFVFALTEIPNDPYLGPLVRKGRVSDLLEIEVTTEIFSRLLGKGERLPRRALEDLSELLLRLMYSFLDDPGPKHRSPENVRQLVRTWIVPAIRERTRRD